MDPTDQTPQSDQTDQPHSDQTTQPQDDQTKGRGPKWTTLEVEQLAISWIAISQDPLFATNQSGTEFYTKVTEHYNKVPNLRDRTMTQVKSYWKKLNTATLKFSGIYAPLERNPPSGSAPADYMNIAKTEYERQTDHAFVHEAAWQILRYAPKWAAVADPVKTTSTSISGLSSNDIQESTSPTISSERPVGQKKSKRQRDKNEIEIERNKELKRATDIQERKADVLQKSYELADRALKLDQEAKASKIYQDDMKILTTSLDTCPDEESKEVLKLMKAKLLKKYRELEGAQDGN